MLDYIIYIKYYTNCVPFMGLTHLKYIFIYKLIKMYLVIRSST